MKPDDEKKVHMRLYPTQDENRRIHIAALLSKMSITDYVLHAVMTHTDATIQKGEQK